MQTVLIVEDERDIGDVIEHGLRKGGFDVRRAADGRSAVEQLDRSKPDLVLLDLMLPEVPGVEVLKILKSRPETETTPVIVLTAKGEEIDRVLCFELGADDYVIKPFSPRELLLRVRSVLKRSNGRPADGNRKLRAGPIEIDLEFHLATVFQQPVELTVTEFRLLEDLIRARGRVRTREALLTTVWGYESEVISRTVDTHMRRLRAKLGPAAGWLGTVRGIGYKIQDPAKGD